MYDHLWPGVKREKNWHMLYGIVHTLSCQSGQRYPVVGVYKLIYMEKGRGVCHAGSGHLTLTIRKNDTLECYININL